MKAIIVKFIATLAGVGYIPILGGTAGSLLALLYFVWVGPGLFFYVSLVFFSLLSLLICGRAERLFGWKDPRQVIIDDFTGMLACFLFIPYEAGWIAAAFLLFRVVDSLKWYPIKRIESWGGSLGVLGDDLAAALYAGSILFLLRTFFF